MHLRKITTFFTLCIELHPPPPSKKREGGGGGEGPAPQDPLTLSLSLRKNKPEPIKTDNLTLLELVLDITYCTHGQSFPDNMTCGTQFTPPHLTPLLACHPPFSVGDRHFPCCSVSKGSSPIRPFARMGSISHDSHADTSQVLGIFFYKVPIRASQRHLEPQIP